MTTHATTTQWQQLCIGLTSLHRRNSEGFCMACSRAQGQPVRHPCPRARMAAPVVASIGDDVAFQAFLADRAPGSAGRAPT